MLALLRQLHPRYRQAVFWIFCLFAVVAVHVAQDTPQSIVLQFPHGHTTALTTGRWRSCSEYTRSYPISLERTKCPSLSLIHFQFPLRACAAPLLIMLAVTNNTAPDCDSIWKGLGEKTFRNTVAALSFASKNLPSDSRVFAVDEWERQHHLDDTSQRRLSLKDEQRLADDLASIAASREGGKAVSAVALEEQLYPPILTVRLAANGQIPEQVPQGLHAFLAVLRTRAEKGLHRVAV